MGKYWFHVENDFFFVHQKNCLSRAVAAVTFAEICPDTSSLPIIIEEMKCWLPGSFGPNKCKYLVPRINLKF
jgi:hypothetical protein